MTESDDFVEEQRFLSTRLTGVLVLGIMLASCALVAMGHLRNLIGIGVALAVVAFFAMSRLVVRVSAGALDLDFRPFVKRRIQLNDIASCEARTYHPIREYGGWGVRWGWKGGRAYNVRGNRGIQIVLRNGDSILVGSQRTEDLLSSVRNGIQSA